MKTKILRSVSIAVAASTLLSFAGSAEAFTFGTQGIKFDQDTNVDFNFNTSHGAFISALKVFEVINSTPTAITTLLQETKQSDNGSQNGWLGTCGNTVLVCQSSFLFKQGVNYTLGLDSGNNNIVYSTTALNPGNTQQAVFGSFGSNGADGTAFDPTPFQSGNPFTIAVKTGFDDRGNNNDRDFQDFTFTVKAANETQVPEPATLGGLALVVGSLAFARRRTRTAD